MLFAEPAMGEENAPVGQSPDDLIVGDHEDGVTLRVELAKEVQQHRLVVSIQVAGRLVRQDQLRLVDQRSPPVSSRGR
jgi:hypothetical protein